MGSRGGGGVNGTGPDHRFRLSDFHGTGGNGKVFACPVFWCLSCIYGPPECLVNPLTI